MNRPSVRISASSPDTREIFPQVGYEISYWESFKACEGATVSALLPAIDGFTFFTVSGMAQKDVEKVILSLASL